MIVVKILVEFYEVWNVIDVSRDFIINYVYIVIYCVFYWKYDKIIFFFFCLGYDCFICLWNLDSKICV